MAAIWYRAGSVQVTNGSSAITGTGTAFVDNVKRGDAFQGPDGRSYEILAINSQTSLTLAGNYQGSSASEQAYAIQPTRGLTVEFTESAVNLLNAIQGFVDGPLAGRFPSGSAGAPSLAFAAQTNTGFFRPSTSVLALSVNGAERARFTTAGMQLTGLLTGTAVTQSPTDTTAGRLIRVQDGYVKGSILGTVSQSGGVPTGAIIQRGSNSNGRFTRFADGTQICTRLVSRTNEPITTPVAGIHVSDRHDYTFPASFVEIPTVSMTSNRAPFVGTFALEGGKNISEWRLRWGRVSSGSQDVEADLTAIGRWF